MFVKAIELVCVIPLGLRIRKISPKLQTSESCGGGVRGQHVRRKVGIQTEDITRVGVCNERLEGFEEGKI
jgi:hypothetical protein